MIQILFDLHTHTTYSHGKGSVKDNAQIAVEKKISLGIADHGPGHCFFGVRKRGLYKMAKDIDNLNNQNQGRKWRVLQGIEANIMGKNGQTDLKGISELDYYLVGYHKGIFPLSNFSLELSMMAKKNREQAKNILTQAWLLALEDKRIDAITHPGEYIPVDMPLLAEAATKKGVLLELNNKHPMPLSDVRLALDAGAFFLISSDAHKPEDVGNFKNIIRLVEDAKIPEGRIFNCSKYNGDSNLRLNRIKSLLTWN